MKHAWVLSGDTFMHKEEIRRKGFRWQGGEGRKEKVWAKEYDAGDFEGNQKIREWLKTLKGVTVTIESAENLVVGSKQWYRPFWEGRG